MVKKFRNRTLDDTSTFVPRTPPSHYNAPQGGGQGDRPVVMPAAVAANVLTESHGESSLVDSKTNGSVESIQPPLSDLLEEESTLEFSDMPLGKIEMSRSQRRRLNRKKGKSLDIPDTPEPESSSMVHEEFRSVIVVSPSDVSSRISGAGDANKPPKAAPSPKKMKSTVTVHFSESNDARSSASVSPIGSDHVDENLRKSVKASADRVVALERQLAEKDAQAQRKTEQLTTAHQEETKKVTKELDKLKREAVDRQSKLDACLVQIKEYENAVKVKDQVEAKLKDSIAQFRSIQSKTEDLNRANEELAEKNETLENQLLNEAKSRNEEAELFQQRIAEQEHHASAEIDGLRRTLAEAEAQLKMNNSMLPEISTLRQELEVAQKNVADNASLAKELEEVRKELANKKGDKEVKKKLTDLTTELDGAKIKLHQMEEVQRRNVALEEKLAVLTPKLEKLDRLGDQVEELQRSLGEQEITLNKYSAEMERLRSANEVLREEVKKAEQNRDNGYSSTMSSRSSPERSVNGGMVKKTEITVVSSSVPASRLSQLVTEKEMEASGDVGTSKTTESKRESLILEHVVEVDARPQKIEERARGSGDQTGELDTFGMPGFGSPPRSANVGGKKNESDKYVEVCVAPHPIIVQEPHLVPLIEPSTDVAGSANGHTVSNGKAAAGASAGFEKEVERPKKLSSPTDLTFCSEAAALSAESSVQINVDRHESAASQSEDNDGAKESTLEFGGKTSDNRLAYLALCGGSFGLGIASAFAFGLMRR